jgi:hypothetical protein
MFELPLVELSGHLSGVAKMLDHYHDVAKALGHSVDYANKVLQEEMEKAKEEPRGVEAAFKRARVRLAGST